MPQRSAVSVKRCPQFVNNLMASTSMKIFIYSKIIVIIQLHIYVTEVYEFGI